MLAVTGGNHYDLLVRLPRLPRSNDRLAAQEAILAPGGMGGNVATTFARLGGQARFAGSFTDDEDGAALRCDMDAEGIDIGFASSHPANGHQRGFILVGECGERAILGLPFQAAAPPRSTSRELQTTHTPPGSGWKATFLDFLREHPLPQELFRPPLDGFYCPGAFAPVLTAQLPPGLPLFIDIETGHLDAMSAPEIMAILRRATIAFGNDENLQSLPGRLGCSSLPELASAATTTIVETRGDAGCTIHVAGRSEIVRGFRVDAVDTTGAGDCFAGAFIFSILRGMALPDAARFGNAAAALSTLSLGSRGRIPSIAAVERLLATCFRNEMTIVPRSARHD